MEDIMKKNDIEESETVDEVEEISGEIDVLPLLVAFVGGVATPFVVKGARTLYTIAKRKWKVRRIWKENNTGETEVVDV